MEVAVVFVLGVGVIALFVWVAIRVSRLIAHDVNKPRDSRTDP